MSDEYGTTISQHQVEEAVLDLLRGVPENGQAPLIVYYLADQERKNGLRARKLEQPVTYRGGSDFTQWKTDDSPLIVVVVKTTGAPGRLDTTQYRQDFQVQVGSIIKRETEHDARLFTSLYGSALMKLIADHGSIGPNPYDDTLRLATHTEITGYPIPDFAVNDTTSRNIMRSVVTFTTRVSPILEQGGPLTFVGSPYATPGDWPDVVTVDTTLTALPLPTD